MQNTPVEPTRNLTPDERQFAVQLALENGKVLNFSDLLRLPAYRDSEITGSVWEIPDIQSAPAQRLRRDLQAMINAGIPIRERMNARGQNEYFLDTSLLVELPVTTPQDFTLLRSILGYKADGEVESFAQSALTKLLPLESSSGSTNGLRTRVPIGKFISQIAIAISQEKFIDFDYYSASSGEVKKYRALPCNLQVHYESFYLFAKVANKDETSLELRTFKTSRIASEPVMVEDTKTLRNLRQTHAVETNTENFGLTEEDTSWQNHPQNNSLSLHDKFALVDAEILIVTKKQLPLADFAISLGDNRYRLNEIYLGDLFAFLDFYGTDVELVEPRWAREAYLDTLRYFANLGGE
ncbi:MAG: WYL domain-containing protein [Arcanobacterium sp.]|nr:WYL domain-containing protein [Arcanobacterium sp.]